MCEALYFLLGQENEIKIREIIKEAKNNLSGVPWNKYWKNYFIIPFAICNKQRAVNKTDLSININILYQMVLTETF